MKKITNLVLLCLSASTFSQNIDDQKVEKIGDILCECLLSNETGELSARIDECGSVLSKGLSVISSDSIKNIYARKSDIYLQKNCVAYLKIILEKNPNSDISLSTISEFNSLKDKSISVKEELNEKNLSYKSFMGDNVLVLINEDNLIEKSQETNEKAYFLINEESHSLTYVSSTDDFYNDYYKKGEVVKFLLLRNNDSVYNLLVKYSNGIVLNKLLHWRR